MVSRCGSFSFFRVYNDVPRVFGNTRFYPFRAISDFLLLWLHKEILAAGSSPKSQKRWRDGDPLQQDRSQLPCIRPACFNQILLCQQPNLTKAAAYPGSSLEDKRGLPSMPIFREFPAGTFTCSCGAVYRVTFTWTPIPDTESAECEVCGKTIRSWRNLVSWPSYELIERP